MIGSPEKISPEYLNRDQLVEVVYFLQDRLKDRVLELQKWQKIKITLGMIKTRHKNSGKAFGQPQQAKILALLLSGRVITNSLAINTLDISEHTMSPKNVLRVNVCNLRSGLKFEGIEIINISGLGYKMNEDSADKFKALMAEANQ